MWFARPLYQIFATTIFIHPGFEKCDSRSYQGADQTNQTTDQTNNGTIEEQIKSY